MVTLLLTEKGGETKQLAFEKDEVTIGRVQGNDVVLPKGNVSKRHSRIIVQNGRFSVEDLKSTNGTYINGRKIAEPTFVGGNDKIYVGDFVIKIENAAALEPTTGGPAEAGSLSTALPRRPPPPPAPGRATATMRALDEEQLNEIRNRSVARTNAPPPPPPSRNVSAAVDSGLEGIDLGLGGPPAPSDVDMDDEPLSARPRLPVPPLKSPRPLLTDEPRSEGLNGRDAMNALDDLQDDVKTGHRDRAAAVSALRMPSSASPSATARPIADGAGGWLRDLLASEGATAVFVTGDRIEVERAGQREPAELPLGASVADAVRALASRGSPRPAGDTRVVNVLLPENARLAALFPPVAGELTATLQKLPALGRSLGDLANAGVVSDEARQLIVSCVATRRNVLIGGDGRALEAVLQAVAASIPPSMRVVNLAGELSPPEGASWTKLSMDTRVSDIVQAAASLRPDYLIVEVSAPPLATDVLSQCVLGREGTMVAIAARSAADALERLAALAGPALGGISHARELAATAFDLVICAGTRADGSVRVLEIGEPRPDGSGQLEVAPLVVWSPEGPQGGRFEIAGKSQRLAATLAARGEQLPRALGRK